MVDGLSETLKPEELDALEKLARAAEKVAPGQWHSDHIDSEDGRGPCHAYAVFSDADYYRTGRTILIDTINSQNALMEQDDGKPWDENGRVVCDFIAMLDPPTVIRLIAAARSQPHPEGGEQGQGSALDGWRPMTELPCVKDHRVHIHVRSVTSYRWEPYKPDGRRQMKKAGRWQIAAGEYGGWENADLPYGFDWQFATGNAPLPQPPVQQTASEGSRDAIEPSDAGRSALSDGGV